jgi:hypothetical protein
LTKIRENQTDAIQKRNYEYRKLFFAKPYSSRNRPVLIKPTTTQVIPTQTVEEKQVQQQTETEVFNKYLLNRSHSAFLKDFYSFRY